MQRETSHWAEAPPEPGVVKGLPYFVSDRVYHRLRMDQVLLWQVEKSVQADLRRHWTALCRDEQAEKRELEARVAAGSAPRAHYRHRLEAHRSPGCDNMQKFFGAGAGASGGAAGARRGGSGPTEAPEFA